MSPIGSAGTAVGVAGSGAQAIGSIISAKPAASAVANGVGLGGSFLSAVQLTIDLNQGKSISTGDLISIGIGIPLGIAVATGAIGAGSVLLPVGAVAAFAAPLLNIFGFTLDDIFKLYQDDSYQLTKADHDAVERLMQELFPLTYQRDAISLTIGSTPDPLVKTVRYVDPLIFDLNGDGLEITPLENRILFDSDGDAIKTGTAWVGAEDGLLVWDRNGNGQIDSGKELFGDETLLNNGEKAAHGFAALSELDVGSVVEGQPRGRAMGYSMPVMLPMRICEYGVT